MQHNFYRLHRKGAGLTQSDIAFLLDSSDYSFVSRFESGMREPSFEFLLLYHLLFEKPIEAFLHLPKQTLHKLLIPRIQALIGMIRDFEGTPKAGDQRILFLETALERLSRVAL